MSNAEYKRRFKIAAYTEKWAVTMTKVRIRQAVSAAPFPRWHLLTFSGPDGGESRGVVDLIAIRKDHHARAVVLATWKKGSAARFFALRPKGEWLEVADLKKVFF